MPPSLTGLTGLTGAPAKLWLGQGLVMLFQHPARQIGRSLYRPTVLPCPPHVADPESLHEALQRLSMVG